MTDEIEIDNGSRWGLVFNRMIPADGIEPVPALYSDGLMRYRCAHCLKEFGIHKEAARGHVCSKTMNSITETPLD